MTNGNMTRFIESFTTQQMLPPWVSQGARYWCLMIDVPDSCIKAYLDEHFNKEANEPLRYHYAPMPKAGVGVLLLAEHPHFTCAPGGILSEAVVSHRELFWSFPAIRYVRNRDNLLTEPTQVLTQPFSFDDNSYILFSSREVWGGEKQLATIIFDKKSKKEPLCVEVSVQGFKTFSPRTRACNIGVMYLELPNSQAPAEAATTIRDNDAYALFGHIMPGILSPAKGSGEPLSEGPGEPLPFKIDTLKQFRDVFDLRAATYRALVSSQVTPSNLRDVKVLNGNDVTLELMWSASMSETYSELFGLTPPVASESSPTNDESTSCHDDRAGDWNMPHSTIHPLFAVSFTADMQFEALDTLYTYRQGQ